MRIPILTKITLPYLVLAIAIALGGSYLVSQVILDSVEERFANQLIETGFQASEIWVRQENELLEDFRSIAFASGMSKAIEEGNISAIRSLLIPSAYNANVAAFVVLDQAARVLLSGNLDSATQSYTAVDASIHWNELDFVSAVLEGQSDAEGDKFIGLASISNQDFLFVAGPINNGAGVQVGSLLVGQTLEQIIGVVRRETLAQMGFYFLDERTPVSSLNSQNDLEAGLAELLIENRSQGSVSRAITDGSVNYTELLTPIEVRNGTVIGVMGVALPNSFIAQTSSITRNNTFILIGLVLFFVLIVGFYVARIITRPIQDLKEAAEKVSQGDLSVHVNSRGRDEVGILANSFNEMVSSVSQSKLDLVNAYDKTIEGWAKALDLRDHETEGHSRRVTELTLRLATRLGISENELVNIRRGSLLHDIGKIGIPDSILLKKGSLSSGEFEIMRQHPVFGRDFMGQIDFLAPALDIPYCHHEKWDGSGYPRGLKGTEIPKTARIFAVVDVWDAITSDRPYRRAMPYKKAVSIIGAGKGNHFDPEVAVAFLRMIAEIHNEPRTGNSSNDASLGKPREADQIDENSELQKVNLPRAVVDRLEAEGIYSLAMLRRILAEDEDKILAIKGIGKKSLEKLKML